MAKITVKGKEFDVTMPALDLREELALAYIEKRKRGGISLQRVYAAMIALCLPEVAFALRIDARGARADLADYGGDVYVRLKGRGWTPADLAEAGGQLFVEIGRETFPRESEVEAATGN